MTALATQMVAYGRSLFDRGYSCGSSGNLSVRLDDGGYLMTPTNVGLGELDPWQFEPARRCRRSMLRDCRRRRKPGCTWPCTAAVRAIGRSFTCTRPTPWPYRAAAIATRGDMLPPITPYVIMRVGRVPLVPYGRPGDSLPERRDHAACVTAPIGAPRQPRPGRGGRQPGGRGRRGRRARGNRTIVLPAGGAAPQGLTEQQVEDVRRVFGA